MATIVLEIRAKLRKLGDKKRAKVSQSFFKTGPGEYGEGDIFLGIRVPDLRKLAKEYQEITISEATQLLRSPIHEERLLAVFILVLMYSRGDESRKGKLYQLYLSNTRFINNWDIVDASSEYIVGAFLIARSKKPLYSLARSNNLWERRISILSTFHYIKQNKFDETLKISRMLKSDKEDLIHKAVGWMLREVGNRNLQTEEKFLKAYYRKMPRTMLRYAIEKFPSTKRERYLKGRI
jgi:3-methyladenine DNA glycosylase AlkD